MNKDLNLFDQITTIFESSDERQIKAERLAEAIRLFRDYRWVGIYEVNETEIAAIAWSGQGEPAYPRFSKTKGLSGEAVATGNTIISNDVENDPRYLTAFGSTQSEIIVPVINSGTGKVIGTVDVESEHKNAFADADRNLLEKCARELTRLWK